jgi:amino acid adenylation domain-containing protein
MSQPRDNAGNIVSASFVPVCTTFEATAMRVPTRPAVAFEDQVLTFAELNQAANRLAHRLLTQGVRPGARIGILIERSVDWLVAILGIWKCGAAYVPVDPSWPDSRINKVVSDAQLTLLLVDSTNNRPDALTLHDCDRRLVSSGEEGGNDHNLAGAVRPSSSAYLIYTSGSTGDPKGVVVEHHSLSNLYAALQQAIYAELPDACRVSVNGPLVFDTSVKQLIQVAAGHTLVIVPDAARLDPERFASFLAKSRLDVLDCTPTQLRFWLDAPSMRSVRLPPNVFVGGEAIDPTLWMALLARNETTFYNLYGPTECTVDALLCRVTHERRSPSLGRPLLNTEVEILDATLSPVSGTAPGELYISGEGVARGYWRSPRLTASRFVARPGSAGVGRAFRTGDLARRLDNGEIEFLGRVDRQVKIRGVRIELDEVEAVLSRHPDVCAARVTFRASPSGLRRLVGYAVPSAAPTPTDVADFRRRMRLYLRRELPEHMVPQDIVCLYSLPVSLNGKIDDTLLPEPEADVLARRSPSTTGEQVVAGIWSDVLGRPVNDVTENFLDIGGHSLMLVQILARVRAAFGVDISVEAFFESDTIEKQAFLAEFSNARPKANENSIPRAAAASRYPLSYSQERVCFLEKLAPGNTAYIFRTIIRVEGQLNVETLETTLTELVRRHSSLRTSFCFDGDKVWQVVHPPWRPSVRVIHADRARHLEVVEALAADEFKTPFDIAAVPLVRWALVTSEGLSSLLHTEHHLVHDGWSFNVFLREFQQLYSAYSEGLPSPLPEPTLQFVDYCVWQREWMQSLEARGQLDYWISQLHGAPLLLNLPLDRPRPHAQSFRGAVKRFEVPSSIAQGLRRMCLQQNVTLFMSMLAAYFVLLHRYSGQDGICIGSGFASRRHPEAESLIGMMVNTVVLRLDITPELTLLELLQLVREVTLKAYANQEVPFEAVVEALRPPRSAAFNPLFQAAFSFHDSQLPPLTIPGGRVEVLDLIDNGSAKFDLSIIAIPRAEQSFRSGSAWWGDGITMIWEYSSDLFNGETIDRLMLHYTRILSAMARSLELGVRDLDLLTDEEQRYLQSGSE